MNKNIPKTGPGSQPGVCKKCKSVFSSKFQLGDHYKKYPSHRPYYHQGKPLNRTRGTIRGYPKAPTRVYRRKKEYSGKPINYCPQCGLPLAGMSIPV